MDTPRFLVCIHFEISNMANNNDINIENKENSQFIDEMLKYKQEIVDALMDPGNNQNRMFENDQRIKNAMIMSAMFENCDEVTMYCGEMSIFRKSFYDEIDNVTDEEKQIVLSEVCGSLNNFIDKNNKLTIIVENFEKRFLNELISSKIKTSRNLCIKKVNKDRLWTSVLSHTAIGKKDNKVVIRRRETNSRSYSARCLVNLGPEIANDSIKLMSYINNASDPIKINSLQ